MPEYLSPGVYVEEVPSGAKPIEGVSTGTAGFLGQTERGPESPQFITSWLEYQRVFGSYVPSKSYLAYAVQGFFDNGGQRCFIGRIIADDAAFATGKVGSLNVSAVGRGQWGNNVFVAISQASQAKLALDRDPATTDAKAKWISVSVYYGGIEPNHLKEHFDNLTHEMGAGNDIINTINGNSHFIRVWWDSGQQPAELAPTATQDDPNNSEVQLPNPPALENGDDGVAVTPAHYAGTPDAIPGPATAPVDDELFGRGRGLASFATIDEIALLVIPDEVKSGFRTLTTDAVKQCSQLKDRFAIVSADQNTGAIQGIFPPEDTTYAAYYYPWIKVFDPSINYTRLIPPSGHVAGIFARSDIERGVWKAPANEVVIGAVNLQKPVTKGQQDLLSPRGVNCLRDFRADGRGLRVWGARTMSGDPEWKYINVRRLFIMIEESIDEGTQWVVFESNDETTWGRVVRVVSDFLTSVWRDGGLMGTTTEEAFFVKCDRTTMTQNDIDNGRLICYIGIAPVKPAEFVIFRISQKTAELAA